jgi:hypothetical protein
VGRRLARAWIFPGCLALACAGAVPARDDPGCPDTKASPVDAKTTTSGGRRCGLGLSLFGKGFGVFGPKCPDAKFLYPAYPACKGETNKGTRCTIDGKLEVKLKTCTCVVFGILNTGVRLPDCDCQDSGSAGFVETGKTVDCEEA